MIQFYSITKEQFDGLSTSNQLNTNNLYFISDTAQIYKGDKSFTDSIVYTNALPTEDFDKSKLYCGTEAISVYVNDKWEKLVFASDISGSLLSVDEILDVFDVQNDSITISKPLIAEKGISASELSVSDLSDLKINSETLKNVFDDYLPLSGGEMTGTLRTPKTIVEDLSAATGNISTADMAINSLSVDDAQISVATIEVGKFYSDTLSTNILSADQMVANAGSLDIDSLSVDEAQISVATIEVGKFVADTLSSNLLSADQAIIDSGNMNIDSLSVDEAQISVGIINIGEFYADTMSANILSANQTIIDSGDMNIESMIVESADVSVGNFYIDNFNVDYLSVVNNLSVGDNLALQSNSLNSTIKSSKVGQSLSLAVTTISSGQLVLELNPDGTLQWCGQTIASSNSASQNSLLLQSTSKNISNTAANTGFPDYSNGIKLSCDSTGTAVHEITEKCYIIGNISCTTDGSAQVVVKNGSDSIITYKVGQELTEFAAIYIPVYSGMTVEIENNNAVVNISRYPVLF